MSPVDYHALTHRPKAQGGTDPIDLTPDIPWARISKGFDAANQTIANNSYANLTFNHDYNMGAGESGEAYFETSATTGLKVLQAGVYIFTVEIYWLSVVGATWFLGLTQTTPANSWIAGNMYAGQSSTDMVGVFTLTRRMEANSIMHPTVWQITGGPRDVDAYYLEGMRIGDYTGTERAAMDPPQ